MARTESGYGIKSKTFAEAIYKSTSRVLIMTAFLAFFCLIIYAMDSMVVVYSTFMPYALLPSGMVQLSEGIRSIGYAISALVIAYYMFCGFFGKKHVELITVGAILHTIDTIMVVFIFCRWPNVSVAARADMMLHVLYLLYWYAAVYFCHRVKKLPDDEPLPENEPLSYNPAKGNSSMLRIADKDVKARILLEAEYDGQHICYRRIKRTNELVIDGYVYDEIEMLIEPPHVLSAQRKGHLIEVGMDKNSRSFIRIDGQEIKRKLRMV